jgi:hypothetical protein
MVVWNWKRSAGASNSLGPGMSSLKLADVSVEQLFF